jgi:hypothetical protein
MFSSLGAEAVFLPVYAQSRVEIMLFTLPEIAFGRRMISVPAAAAVTNILFTSTLQYAKIYFVNSQCKSE